MRHFTCQRCHVNWSGRRNSCWMCKRTDKVMRTWGSCCWAKVDCMLCAYDGPQD